MNDQMHDGDDVSVDIEDDGKSTTDDSASSPSGGDSKSTAQPALAQQETKAVGYSRLLVVLVLGIVATVAAVATYRYTTDQEEEDFETRVCCIDLSRKHFFPSTATISNGVICASHIAVH